MPFGFDSLNRIDNCLLSLLPEAEYEQLQPLLERVSLPLKYLFFERNQPIPYIYFPCTAIGSALALLENGAAVEACTIGNEGVIGLEVFLGGDRGLLENVCQVAGEALRMRADDFRRAIQGDTALRRVIQCYSQAYIRLASQSVACNCFHTVEERCARWLLMTQDRVHSNQFMLTQEFLADMLGTHRPSVSLVAGTFQKAGIITYKRGLITVLDRAALESASCECYGIVKEQYERLLGANAVQLVANMKK